MSTSGHVVVTGASAGVGRATAVAFGRRGWRVSLIARGHAGLAGAKAEVEAAGGRAQAIPTDVADPAAVEKAAERAEDTFGPFETWVNVAMATLFGPVAAITAEEFRRVTDVTYHGQVYGTMAALKRMRPRDRGTIVNVGSALAYHGLPLQAAYCGAKFAARGFTESLRSELIHDNSRVRLSFVVLPAINTPQFDWARNKMAVRPQPVPPVYQPEVAARAIVHAAFTAPREISVGLSSLQLQLGAAAAPGYLDRKLAQLGYSGQMSGEPASPGRPDNLFEPVHDDFGIRGRFGRIARSAGISLPTAVARDAVVATGVALPAIAALVGFLAGRRR